VSINGNPYARFRRSLETRRLSVVLLAAAELPQIQLEDALEILTLMAQEHDPRFDRAAARWVGRLLAENPLGLADGRYALALVERLPSGVESLRRLARRR
jgi:HEAT repeat protein